MGSPKDITEALSRWQGENKGQAPKQQHALPTTEPSLRRLRTDIPGNLIYTLVVGALLSQVIFMVAFDLF